MADVHQPTGRRRLVLILGRWSSPNGTDSCAHAVDDLIGAVREYDFHKGTQLMGKLPEKSDLIRRLRDKVPERSRSGPNPEDVFQNRFLLIKDLLASDDALLSLSVGSALKLTDNHDQPHGEWVIGLLDEHLPSELAYKRPDRLCRDPAAAAKVVGVAARYKIMLCDEEGFVDPTNDTVERAIFDRVVAARRDAKRLRTATRRNMIINTGEEFVDGQVAYACSPAAPAGLAVVRFVNTDVGKQRMMMLDRPHTLPYGVPNVTGLPQVTFDRQTGDGDTAVVETLVADQVANVRLAWEMKAAKNSDLRIATELTQRGYSTEGLRRLHRSASAAFPTPTNATDANSMLRTIFNNFDLYELGKIVIPLGEGLGEVEITEVWPDDGDGWAEPHWFDVVRGTLERNRQIRGAHIGLALSGLCAEVDGVPYRLVKRDLDLGPGRLGTYGFVLDKRGSETWTAVEPLGVRLPHQLLAESLVVGILKAADQGLIEYLAGPSELDDRELVLVQRVAKLSEEQTRVGRSIKNRLAFLDEDGDEDEDEALTSALRGEIKREINGLAVERDQIELDLAAATEALEQQRAAALAARSMLEADVLPALVATLRDPFNRSMNKLLRSAIRDLRFETENATVGRLRCQSLRWTGRLVLADGDLQWEVPFEGVMRRGNGFVVGDRTDELTAGLLLGHTFIASDVALKDLLIGGVSAALGRLAGRSGVVRPLAPTDKGFCLWASDSPFIVQVVARWFAGAEVLAIAADLGASSPVIERVLSVNTDKARRRTWFEGRVLAVDRALLVVHEHREMTTRALADAVRGGAPSTRSGWKELSQLLRRLGHDRAFTVTDGTIRAKSCRWCEGGPLVRLGIREVDGLVCLRCRRDVVGLEWDTGFDSYVVGFHEWAALGEHLVGPPFDLSQSRRSPNGGSYNGSNRVAAV